MKHTSIWAVSSLGSINFDYSVCSSRGHHSRTTVTDAVASLVVLAFMGLNRKSSTLKQQTYACFRISHSFTAPSCPQLNSSKGFSVKHMDMTDCSWASNAWTILDLSNTRIMLSSKAPARICPLEATLFLIGGTYWSKFDFQPEIGCNWLPFGTTD